MPTVTGAMHIHTSYSFDGTISLDELAEVARKKGHNFLLLTEHNDDFDDWKMAALVEHCERLSGNDLLVIPGLEIDCDFGRHLLALGVKRCIPGGKPDQVAASIAAGGGLAILPHPHLCQFRSFLDSIENLNGVEVWNIRYDGRHAPDPRSFALLHRLRERNAALFAYGGLDLHDIKEIDDLSLVLELPRLNEREILQHLRDGAFEVVRRRTVVSSTGTMTGRRRLFFEIAD